MINSIIDRVVNKKIFRKWHGYDLRHKRKAMEAVRVIQKHNSQKLTEKLKKTVDDYSIEVLGSKKFAPWLYVYTLVKGEFREGWIPDNFFGRLVSPEINKRLRVVPEFKTFSNIVLNTETLPDLGYYIDGVFYNKDFSITNLEEFRREISSRNQFNVILKKDGSEQGKGVARVKVEKLLEKKFESFGNCVIQSQLEQHEFFNDFVSGPLATVRITTVKDKLGKIGMRAAYLRLGRKGESWVQTKSLVRVAIVDDSGCLDEFGYTPDWCRWQYHPDTNFAFSNHRIPIFKECVEMCIELHEKVPHITIIGWDMAICDDETTKVIEWNAKHCDIKFSEASTGPCFLGLGWEKYKIYD